MSTPVTVVARANIALAKYWGKRPGARNVPAVPSLSVTLEGLTTTTTAVVDASLLDDEIVLNGRRVSGEGMAKAARVLDELRASASAPLRLSIRTSNDFPTASGLASSASGFAALALAASRALGLDWSRERVAEVARLGSASAARSLFSGFVELVPSPSSDTAHAREVAPADALPLVVLVAVVTEEAKAVSSTAGMNASLSSPFYGAWLDDGPRAFADMKAAIETRDLAKTCALAERSALALHALTISSGVIYLRAASMDVIHAVHARRRAGTGAWVTMDAGPHVKVLVHASDAAAVKAELAAIPSVLRVIESRPGGGAEVR